MSSGWPRSDLPAPGSTTLTSDLSNLAGNESSIHTLVTGLQSTVDDGLLRNTPALDELLTPEGVQHTTAAINTTISVIFVLTALGPLAPAVRWLAPMLESLDGTTRAVVPMLFGSHPLDTDSPSNLKKLVDLIQNTIIPFADRGPKIDLAGVGVQSRAAPPAPSVEEKTGSIINALRMIGAVK
jgi:hypothetical protein